jgi:hypothetical protein
LPQCENLHLKQALAWTCYWYIVAYSNSLLLSVIHMLPHSTFSLLQSKMSLMHLLHRGQRFFFEKLCEVGGLGIIHKRNGPEFSCEVRHKVRFFSKSCFVLVTSMNSVSKCGYFWLFSLKIWRPLQNKIRKNPLCNLNMIFICHQDVNIH